MNSTELTSLLESYLDFFYAQEIRTKMYSVSKKKCYGCQNSCLSQLNHSCLALTNRQQLELYFEDILLNVDEFDILSKWEQAVSILDAPSEVVEMYKLKLYCKDWRQADMKTPQWKTKMIQTTVQLLLLERCF